MTLPDLRSSETRYLDSEIARAVMSAVMKERERCAKIAAQYAEDEQRGITKLNRKASSGKKMIAAKNAALDIADAIRRGSAE